MVPQIRQWKTSVRPVKIEGDVQIAPCHNTPECFHGPAGEVLKAAAHDGAYRQKQWNPFVLQGFEQHG